MTSLLRPCIAVRQSAGTAATARPHQQPMDGKARRSTRAIQSSSGLAAEVEELRLNTSCNWGQDWSSLSASLIGLFDLLLVARGLLQTWDSCHTDQWPGQKRASGRGCREAGGKGQAHRGVTRRHCRHSRAHTYTSTHALVNITLPSDFSSSASS